MKILMVSNRFPPDILGGAEINVHLLATQLIRMGHSIAIITTASDDSAELVDGMMVHRLRVANIYQPFTGKRSGWRRALWHAVDVYNPRMGSKVDQVLNQERPDILVSHNLAGLSVSVWKAAKRRAIPIVHVLHDYYLLCPATNMVKDGMRCAGQCTKCQAYSAYRKRATDDVDVVIGVSRCVLSKHLSQRYFARARSHVVHPGVAKIRGEGLPASTGSSQARLRIGFIGRLEPMKGLDVLLRAVTQLPTSEWELSVAGIGSSPAYVNELKRKFPGAAQYLGFVAGDEFYPRIDVLVVPSVWDEPFGLIAVEAMAFGVPVIASRLGGLAEIVDLNDYGWLVEPGSDAELAAVLKSLIADRRLLAAKRSAALQRRGFFTPERQAEEFMRSLEGAFSSSSQ
jgi:glycosyltransferase involved in cell wall biosynthesis